MQIQVYRDKVNWLRVIRQLLKRQWQIYNMDFDIRRLRNIQRLIRKSFLSRCLIVNYLVQSKYKQTKFNKLVKIHKQKLIYFNSIIELNFDINLDEINRYPYLIYIRTRLENILWLLSYLPIHEKLGNDRYLQNRLIDQNRQLINSIEYSLNESSSDLIQLTNLAISFSPAIKYWLIKFSFFEKKYLIYWFSNYQLFRYQNIIDQIQLDEYSILSLYNIVRAFYRYCFIFFYNSQILNSNNIYWIHFNHLITLNNFFEFKNLTSNRYNLKAQFFLFGWCLQKRNLVIIKSISDGNIQAHQQEIVKFLKNAGTYPIDKVIILLNSKIRIWKKYYLTQKGHSQIIKKLNTYLFHRIWYFIKKRHKGKGVRWLIYHYFKNDKITMRRWTFEYNQIKLINYD